MLIVRTDFIKVIVDEDVKVGCCYVGRLRFFVLCLCCGANSIVVVYFRRINTVVW